MCMRTGHTICGLKNGENIQEDNMCDFQQRICQTCAVALGPVIYMFGGTCYSSDLWKVTKCMGGSFHWNKISMEDHQMPSPRFNPCGWDYREKMWIFGGYGKSLVGFLNNHGDFKEDEKDWGLNNQLFSFDPSVRTWKSMKCFGDVPSPPDPASATAIKDKCWLYGGYSFDWENDLYEPNMNSLAWTHIQHPSVTIPMYITPTSNVS